MRPGKVLVFGLVFLISLESCGVSKTAYVSDSHGGSYFYIKDTLKPQGAPTLVLIDAHSDLVPLRGSQGIQCYNWIQPLIPQTLGRVHWILGGPPENQVFGFEKEMRRLKGLMGDQGAALGPLYDQVSSQTLDQFLDQAPSHLGPVVVTVDLDAFSGFPSLQAGVDRCTRLMTAVLKLPQIQGLSLAVSRNYLTSEEEALTLLTTALRILVQEGWQIQVDRRWTNENERSNHADLQRIRLGQIPSFQWQHLPPDLQQHLK